MVKKFYKIEVTFAKKTKRRYNKKGLTHRKKLGPKSHLRNARHWYNTDSSSLYKKRNTENQGSYLLWYRQGRSTTLC